MTEINNIRNNHDYSIKFEGKKMPAQDTFEKNIKQLADALFKRINPDVKKIYPEETRLIEQFTDGTKKYSLELKNNAFAVIFEEQGNKSKRLVAFPKSKEEAANLLSDNDFIKELSEQFMDIEEKLGAG